MEETAPIVTVGTFSAMDPDTLIHGPPFVFELPPCKENPTCHNGDETFSLIFDPGTIMYSHLNLSVEKIDTTTCAAFILMIKFCFNESFHWTCNWLVLKALRYHLISTCMFELLIQMVQKEMEPALCWQTKCFWENNRSFTTYRSLWETQEEGATTWVGPALWPLKSETKTTISTLMDTRRSLFTTTKV